MLSDGRNERLASLRSGAPPAAGPGSGLETLLRGVEPPADPDAEMPFNQEQIVAAAQAASAAQAAIAAEAMQPGGLDGVLVLRTGDGEIHPLEKRIAFLSPVLQLSYDPANPEAEIDLPEVSSHALDCVLEYCRFHLAPGHSIKERKNFNKSFMRMDTARLCELASASHYLDLKSLIDLTCRW
eukprot:SAG22_NODE_527_length_9437_cov_3.575712_6_plen_183_part_00